MTFGNSSSDVSILCRDMHREECGAEARGLCDKMKPIDGEKLLKYLRSVNFVGEHLHYDE